MSWHIHASGLTGGLFPTTPNDLPQPDLPQPGPDTVPQPMPDSAPDPVQDPDLPEPGQITPPIVA